MSNMFDLVFWSRFACEKPMTSWCDQPQSTAWLLLQLIFVRGALLSVWLLCNLKVLHWIPFWAWSELNFYGQNRQHRFGILCYKVVSGNKKSIIQRHSRSGARHDRLKVRHRRLWGGSTRVGTVVLAAGRGSSTKDTLFGHTEMHLDTHDGSMEHHI